MYVCVLAASNHLKPSAPAMGHHNNLLCCLSPDCCYCHANCGATCGKKREKIDLFSICLLRTSGKCSNLPLPAPHPPPPPFPTLSPSSISLSSLHLPPSLILSIHPLCVFYNHCNNRLIWKTLNYQAPSHLPTLHTHTHSLTVSVSMLPFRVFEVIHILNMHADLETNEEEGKTKGVVVERR